MQRTPRSFHLRSLAQLGAVGLALVVTQTGCPGGADLEHPEAWPDRFGAGAGGATGIGGSAQGGGTGGSTTAGTGNAPPFDITTVVCGAGLSAKTVMTMKCATVGCHNSNLPQAGLVLVPDSGLAGRLKDQPATYADIQCSPPGAAYVACVPTSCPMPAPKIVDSATLDSSWMLRKLRNTQSDCGASMPDGDTLTTDEEACVEAVIKAVAGQ